MELPGRLGRRLLSVIMFSNVHQHCLIAFLHPQMKLKFFQTEFGLTQYHAAKTFALIL